MSYNQGKDYKESKYDKYGYDNRYESHTGDPSKDFAIRGEDFSRRGANPTYIVPEDIKRFLLDFQGHIRDKNVYDINHCYETTFNKLSESYFKNSSWPSAEIVGEIVNNDEVFLILYKELYYRHILARTPSGPDQQQRFESYYNYCNLFNYILNANGGPVDLKLPDQWLWDIIDEFIYQIWNVHSVLNVLHSLVEKSGINQQLEAYGSGVDDPESESSDFGRHPLYKMLGYFSLIGLLRLHSLLGDYYQAIKVLEHIQLNEQTLYSKVAACQISTYYYVGFAYLMMRRYQDSIRSFTNILLFIQRTNRMLTTGSYQVDVIKKLQDKIYRLLALVLTLHPMRIDESVHMQLRDKLGDKLTKMQRGDVATFEECFSSACPRFLSPVPPNYEEANPSSSKEPFTLQVKVFMEEVNQQLVIQTIRSFLKLYTTMPVSKLAIFLDMSEENFRTKLLCFKHKMKNLVWTKGASGLDGEFQSASEVDFYIDGEMIHIADTKVARRYGDFFIRQIHKFHDLNRNLKKIASSN
ncbi:eukaryotic translation initiation factor 3 subunit L isoform X2 [Strongylocentrotus purpuratus]|uniref:Eukaryotic translation initiation factor 3 subunit L n=1 Tax=Strongylocentrotus purpuratus TaxID=7668 RepID=A0A7M7NQE7_STRPU|nr:eukaryotic translation initiation factor 3 subunit L isoform X2 [Strongylocentrotus purpuratus]